MIKVIIKESKVLSKRKLSKLYHTSREIFNVTKEKNRKAEVVDKEKGRKRNIKDIAAANAAVDPPAITTSHFTISGDCAREEHTQTIARKRMIFHISCFYFLLLRLRRGGDFRTSGRKFANFYIFVNS